jgi:hypothetical protein
MGLSSSRRLRRELEDEKAELNLRRERWAFRFEWWRSLVWCIAATALLAALILALIHGGATGLGVLRLFLGGGP